jgi:hypothetical protein
MTVVLFINPLPIMHRPARFWLIRYVNFSCSVMECVELR